MSDTELLLTEMRMMREDIAQRDRILREEMKHNHDTVTMTIESLDIAVRGDREDQTKPGIMARLTASEAGIRALEEQNAQEAAARRKGITLAAGGGTVSASAAVVAIFGEKFEKLRSLVTDLLSGG